MSSTRWESVTLGDVTTESRERAGNDPDFIKRSVYGVDRSIGLTRVAKYTGSSLDRYKTLNHGMFAYNPMRLNIGSIGYCSPDIEPGLVSPDYVVIRCNEQCLAPEFLNYYIDSPTWKDWTASAGVGSVRMRIYYKELARLPLLLPSIKEQRAIAQVLGTLDDKIELNRRMNQTLESMARVVFRQWFVENEEVGDWEVGKVSDLGEVITGKTPPTADRENYDGDVPFITIPDMHGKVFVIETGKTLSDEGVQTQANKTLPAFSICVSCIATPGLVSLTIEPSQTNQQINSLVPEDKDSTFYCYFALRDLGDEIRARGSGGSVLLNLNKSQFEALPVLRPPVELIHKFQEMVEPLLMKLLANEKESRTLASLRDTLLPKLMRGDVRVKE